MTPACDGEHAQGGRRGWRGGGGGDDGWIPSLEEGHEVREVPFERGASGEGARAEARRCWRRSCETHEKECGGGLPTAGTCGGRGCPSFGRPTRSRWDTMPADPSLPRLRIGLSLLGYGGQWG
jgi:hypothetical protein